MGYALDYDPTPNKVALKKFGLAVCEKQNPRQRKPAKECAILNQVFSVIDFAQTSPNFFKAPLLLYCFFVEKRTKKTYEVSLFKKRLFDKQKIIE